MVTENDDEYEHRGMSTPAIQERLKCACIRLDAQDCIEARSGRFWDRDCDDGFDREECECHCHWSDE